MKSASASNWVANKFTGCLVGGAVGDALGWPVEFMSLAEIRATCLPVNHSGGSDSTGAIAGNILGTRLGKGAVPWEWRTQLEMHKVIEEMIVALLP